MRVILRDDSKYKTGFEFKTIENEQIKKFEYKKVLIINYFLLFS